MASCRGFTAKTRRSNRMCTGTYGIIGLQSFIIPHGSPHHPELLHHCAHRPRQVDSGRPPAGSHRRAEPARDDGAGAGHDGPGARARHHHQGARRAAELHGRRRRDVPAEPDRHAGPRGFHLRSLAQPAGLRRARCWWWTPRRASRRRRWPTPIWRSHHNLEIIPVINKIDLPSAEPERVSEQIEHVIGLDAEDALLVSAKAGVGHPRRCWKPWCTGSRRRQGDPDAPLRALIFDSWFDPYRGVIILLRVIDGTRAHGPEDPAVVHRQDVRGRRARATSRPSRSRARNCRAGEVGYLFASIKTVTDAQVGDTITDADDPAAEAAARVSRRSSRWSSPGSTRSESHEHGAAARRAGKAAAERLRASTSSRRARWRWASASAAASSGLLHMEIVQERLEREFEIDLITTAPGVRYRVTQQRRRACSRSTIPTQLARPDARSTKMRRADHRGAPIITREEYLGEILKLLEEKRGEQKKFEYIGGGARDADLRAAAERDRAGFLRPAEIVLARLRLARLPPGRLSRLADGEAGHAGGRRAGGRAVDDRPPATTPTSAARR